MKESTILTEVSPKEMEAIIESVLRRVLNNDKTKENESGLLDDEQISEMLGVSKPTLYLWRRDKKIPFRRIGKKIFYELGEVKKAMGLGEEQELSKEKRTSRRKERKQ